MRGGTLFSGIGAPEIAAPWIDWRWSADVDAFANAVRAHHWPDVPNLGDVGAIEHDAVEPVDLIVFGSPCQSFSVAGKRLGLDDPRGNLALVALGLVARLRPRWFCFENVPGLLSSADGEDFAAFLRAVLQCGYSGAYRVLDAQYFGVPQRRRRLFFVGHLGDDWRPSAAILFEPESLRGDSPPGREAGERVARPIASCAEGSSGYRNDADTADNLIAFGGNDTRGPIQVATACNAHGGAAGRMDFESETFIAFSCKDHGADAGDTAPTLRAMGHDGSHPNAGGQVAVAIQERAVCENPNAGPDGAGFRRDGTSYTLEARTVPQSVAFGPMVRRLTPTECERLQGFPDGFTAIPWRGGTAPDGRRYKALGNAMAVPVLAWILERIRTYEQQESLFAEGRGAA